MSGLKLGLTEKFMTQGNDIQSALSTYLKVGQPQFYSMLSVDPPSFIQILGEAVAWSPLKVAASVYLLTLVKRAGDWTWDKIVNTKEVKPLIDVVEILVAAKESIDGEVHLAIGLNIPDDSFGTAISTKSSDPEEVTRVLASFIVHAEPLSKAMQAAVAAGHRPLGPAIITLQDDGSLRVNWRAQDFSAHEIRVSRTD